MIPTARVGRAHSYRARSASKGIVPATPFSHFLKISLGSVISPIETATNSHPLAPNSFSLVCIFWVSGRTSMILYWNRFGSCAFAANGCPVTNRNPNPQRLTPAINHATERRMFCIYHLALFSIMDAPLSSYALSLDRLLRAPTIPSSFPSLPSLSSRVASPLRVPSPALRRSTRRGLGESFSYAASRDGARCSL